MLGTLISNIFIGIIISFVGAIAFDLIPLIVLIVFRISKKVVRVLFPLIVAGSFIISILYTANVLSNYSYILEANLSVLSIKGIILYLINMMGDVTSSLFKISIIGTILITVTVCILITTFILLKFSKNKAYKDNDKSK